MNLKLILSFLAGLFKQAEQTVEAIEVETVDSITSALGTLAERLEAHNEARKALAAEAMKRAAALHAEAADHNIEASRASQVAERIKSLLG
jgi:hypothetical protein